MKENIKELLECINKIHQLSHLIDDKNYWIEKAKKEANFIPGNNPWIHVEIKFYGITISVYPDHNDPGIYWINGKWFTNPFPKDFPFIKDIESVIKNL